MMKFVKKIERPEIRECSRKTNEKTTTALSQLLHAMILTEPTFLPTLRTPSIEDQVRALEAYIRAAAELIK